MSEVKSRDPGKMVDSSTMKVRVDTRYQFSVTRPVRVVFISRI